MATIKADAEEYRALKEGMAPVLGAFLLDMAELDRQTDRLRFGGTDVDPRLAESVDTGVRSLLGQLGEFDGMLLPEHLEAYSWVTS